MKVLFGVFDWGLGHATRDSPLIEELLKRGHNVDIISTGRAIELLKKRFGKRCRYFNVPLADPPYTKNNLFALNFLVKLPKISSQFKEYRKISEKIINEGKYDKVISDCRYDVYDKVENSYLINHQLRFKILIGGQIAVERILYSLMKKYKKIIVPDFEKNNLTGILSHNLNFLDKSKIAYIGVLSNLKKKNLKKDIDYFVSISGPEPQRTILEKIMLPQLSRLKGKIVVALGKPEAKKNVNNGKIKIYSFLDQKKQEEMMNRAKFVISRSGYTTIMELYELGIDKALLIPTPGQTEQEYLADLYEAKKWFHQVSQHKLDLKSDASISKKYIGFKTQWKTKESVKRFMEILDDS